LFIEIIILAAVIKSKIVIFIYFFESLGNNKL